MNIEDIYVTNVILSKSDSGLCNKEMYKKIISRNDCSFWDYEKYKAMDRHYLASGKSIISDALKLI